MYDFNKCFKKQSTKWEKHTEGISIQKEYLVQINNDSHQPKIAQVIALINTSASSINPTISTSSLIIDPIFLDREACSADSANTIFGRRFGIPFKTSDKKWFIRILTNNEMFRIYSIPIENDYSLINAQADILDDLLPFRIL